MQFTHNNAMMMMAFTEKANTQYMKTHEKWDQLRNKIKALKLDNITTRTYKHQNAEIIKGHNSMFMLKNDEIEKATPIKSKQEPQLPNNTAHLVSESGKKRTDFNKVIDQKSEIKRVYRSKTTQMNEVSNQKIKKERPKIR